MKFPSDTFVESGYPMTQNNLPKVTGEYMDDKTPKRFVKSTTTI
jgi:hypothetical protein